MVLGFDGLSLLGQNLGHYRFSKFLGYSGSNFLLVTQFSVTKKKHLFAFDVTQFCIFTSQDVFNKFKDEDGKFKAHLVADARGMLSLYEAAQWSTPGEDTLDDALAFSNAHLEEISSRSSPHLAIRIKNALKHPFHKGISRIETRKFISYYEAEEKCDSTLLEFAKIDFNLLQMLYRHELACVTR